MTCAGRDPFFRGPSAGCYVSVVFGKGKSNALQGNHPDSRQARNDVNVDHRVVYGYSGSSSYHFRSLCFAFDISLLQARYSEDANIEFWEGSRCAN